MSQTLELTLDLMRRPSVTPADEGCQALMAGRLEKAGFRIEHLKYGNVENLWAVPTGPLEEWRSHPFQPEIREQVLYGRGAADMKSGLAAMVTAVEAFVVERPKHKGSIAFLITSDEEGPSVDGTKRVVEALIARGQRIDWCIVGEPSSEKATGDTLKIGRRGSLSGRLTVHGVQGHIAYPHLAENPVHTFAPALAELTARTWDQGNEHFQPTSFQVSNFNAGTGAPNVIPGELKARFNLRDNPVQTLDGLKAAVEGVLNRHQVRYTLDWHLSGEPFYTQQGRLLSGVVEAVTIVLGASPVLSTGGGTSDGRFIAKMGAEVVELGVPNPSIHKVNEQVRVADIDRLHEVYLQALRNLLA